MKKRILNRLKTCTGFELGSWIVVFLVLIASPPFSMFGTGPSPTNRARLLYGGLGTVIIASLLLWRRYRYLGAISLLPASYVLAMHWPLATILLTIAGYKFSWGILLVDLAALGFLCYVGSRRGWGAVWSFPMVSTMIHMAGGAAVFFYMASPPLPGYCPPIEDQKGVSWMTRGTGLYFGADLAVVGDGERLAITSKAWHDSYLGKYFFTRAHGVAIITNEDPPEGEPWEYRFVEVPWHFLPEFLLADSKGGLGLSFVEWHENHHFGVIREPMSEVPKLDHLVKIPQVPGPLEPNGLVEHDGNYIVFGHDEEDAWPFEAHDSGDILWVDMETLEPGLRWAAPPFKGDPPPCFFSDDENERCGGEGMIVRLDYVDEGNGHVLMSTLGGLILDFDLNTQQATRFEDSCARSAVALALDKELQYVAASDMHQHQICLFNRETTRKIGVHDLPYTPRPLRWLPGQKILFVGGFFTGDLHVYRFHPEKPRGEQLEELADAVQVGGMFRKIQYDAKSGMVYNLTKCGLVRVDPKEAFGLDLAQPATGKE